MMLQSLLRQLLQELGVEGASKIIVEAAEASESASVVASLFIWRGRESGAIPLEGERIASLITDDALNAVGARALHLIKDEAARGVLQQAAYYFDIVRAWAYLETVEVARDWLNQVVLAEPKALSKASLSFLGVMRGDSGASVYAFRGLGDMAPYHDAKVLLEAAEKHAGEANLDADDRARIIALRDGLKAALAREAERGQAKAEAAEEGTAVKPGEAPEAPVAKPRRRARATEPPKTSE